MRFLNKLKYQFSAYIGEKLYDYRDKYILVEYMMDSIDRLHAILLYLSTNATVTISISIGSALCLLNLTFALQRLAFLYDNTKLRDRLTKSVSRQNVYLQNI